MKTFGDVNKVSPTGTESAQKAPMLWADQVGPRHQKFAHINRIKLHLEESFMAYLLFMLVITTLFLRPAEMIPELLGLPIYEGLILGSVLLGIKRLQWQFRVRSLRRQPITYCILLLWFAVILSHLTHFYFYGMKESLVAYLKLLVFYVLLVTLVNSPGRMKFTMAIVAITSSLMVTLCVIDYVGWHDFQFIIHLDSLDGFDDIGAENRVFRMRGTGIFQDPNDLAMLIAISGILCVYFLTEKSHSFLRFFWLLPIGFLGTGLIFTKSRGGLLAVGAAMLIFATVRYGKKVGIAAGVCGVILAGAIAGRQASIDLSDDTGHERILLWRDGLEELKSPNLFFGIGMNEYSDMAGLVAHNSFIHTYVELGFFGGTLFFGCFFFAGIALYKMLDPQLPLYHRDLKRMHPYITAMLVAAAMSMMSLSRCYVPITYLVIGLGAAYITLVNKHLEPAQYLVYWNRSTVKKLIGTSFCLLCCMYIGVKILAR